MNRRDMLPFDDRHEAGEELSGLLQAYAGRSDVIVLGLPRGGVPVAAVVAGALGAPLDVFIVRKLGVPGHRELAMGAIASGGARLLDHALIEQLDISAREIAEVAADEEQELLRRESLYRHGCEPLTLTGRVAILVDDGLATGSTMRVAVQAVRGLGPSSVVVAVPVGSEQACRRLEEIADHVICARVPRDFRAVGQFYLDFSETSDADVRRELETARQPVRETS